MSNLAKEHDSPIPDAQPQQDDQHATPAFSGDPDQLQPDAAAQSAVGGGLLPGDPGVMPDTSASAGYGLEGATPNAPAEPAAPQGDMTAQPVPAGDVGAYGEPGSSAVPSAPFPAEPVADGSHKSASASVQSTGTAAELSARPLPRINIQAFCEDQNTAGLMQLASQDRRLSKAHVTVHMGGLKAATQHYGNAPTPNLIIVESLHQRDGLLMDLDELAGVCDPGTKVLVVGHVNDVLLYRELMMRGVSEYLVMPLTVPQLMESLSNLYNDPNAAPLGSVIAFVGAKGGAGSSTICHNTAWTISQDIQSDVVIADMDLPFGTAGLDFNQDPVQGIADALQSPDRVDEVLLDRLLSRCSDHLSLFAAPGTLDRPYDLSTGACDVVVDVLRKNVPYITVDVPHLWTDWAQQVLIQADRVVITALPDLANLRNTKNLIEKLNAARPNDLAPMLVLNQVGVPKRPEISVKDFASAVNNDPVAVIEFDCQLFGAATNNGQMIEEVSAKSKPVEVFRQLARLLTDREEEKTESTSILAKVLGKLPLKRLGKK